MLLEISEDPVHVGRDSGVNAGVRRLAAPDSPADDSRKNPPRTGLVLHDQRTAAVSLRVPITNKQTDIIPN